MKKSGFKFKRILAVAVVLVTLLLLLFLFSATRSALDVWERLQGLPEPLFYTYVALIAAVILFSLWLIYKLLKPSQQNPDYKIEEVTEENILKELDHADTVGMETAEMRREIEQLQARKETGRIYVALFGDVSTGKSSIVKALLPEATSASLNIDINVRGGSTQDIKQYTWKSTSGDELVLTDLPGRNEASGELDAAVRDEAIRAQIVVYVTDSDLSRSQFDDIQQLKSFGKPMIVALNKSDRFTDKEKQLISERFNTNLNAGTDASIQHVFVQSGGEEEVVKIYPDGREEKVVRARRADVSALAQALQDEIDKQSGALETLRDASVFVLVKQKLDVAKDDFRQKKAEEIIKSSTRKAVLGALASVSPGSDLVIQGVLGTQLVKGLCALYDVPVKQLDIDNLLDFSTGQMKKSVPLILAVAGNGMKAFPGIGTVTGGLTHAVAYGLIFDALGRAVNKTLQQRGQLKPAPAAITFKEMLSEDLESRAKLFAKLVFDKQKQSK
ncbi:50S ribosome-binding GTPase [Cocleimonas sp. KMM 6892]|uniref:GTPase n=1 Tax=unclassified Cocleimonas TaxID=2639732 RepID=UPI002DBF7F65|nr:MULTISPECIES: GTPase [unclassified Cocleimonas]MEB8431792.1 50S ribosome-binding GTPase [Cocleimonas sp. KMM 6892]MEC4715122.1 50S ribosome-binding GTPase [Cocleimonas sp. KMM 6895]MEC4744064.1 50S ribosome-binding GTPase [Cocleimonas sp. KMM 6896]